jgi:hypothetical protein
MSSYHMELSGSQVGDPSQQNCGMTRRVLVIDLASQIAPTPQLLPWILIPLGPGRAAVALEEATVEQVLAELLAAGLPVRRSKVVLER